jgi:hypothetical protein
LDLEKNEFNKLIKIIWFSFFFLFY